MRIIAGRLGGRHFKSPSSYRTHPMSEKMRGAVFNALGDIEGLSVLDAFAGSGALGLEAISRGASSATFVDQDKSAHRTIKENVQRLGLDGQVKAIRANISGWSNNNKEAYFDLIFCDPPYDYINPLLLRKLAFHVKPGGIIVYSLPPDYDFKLPYPDLQRLTSKDYGDAQLIFYKKAV